MSFKAGELYLIGEVDLRTSEDLPFYKIGIVRDKDNRSTEDRLREHQTGNPRLLKAHWVIRTPVVEQIETTLHGRFAPWRISGEWFHLDETQKSVVHKTTKDLATQAEKKEDFLKTAEELKNKVPGDTMLKPSKEAINLHKQLGMTKANLSASKSAINKLKTFFDSLHREGHEVSDYYSLNRRVGTLEFNEDAFKEKHPKLWQKYLVNKSSVDPRFLLTELNAFKRDESLLKPELRDLIEKIDQALNSPKPSKPFMNQMHGHYLEILTIQSPLEWDDELMEAELKAICGNHAGIEGLCTWNRRVRESTSFDKTAFKNEHPDKWDLFTTSRPETTSAALRRDRNYRI